MAVTQDALSLQLSQCSTTRQWLVDHLVSPYWEPNLPGMYHSAQRDPSLVGHTSCNLATNWYGWLRGV